MSACLASFLFIKSHCFLVGCIKIKSHCFLVGCIKIKTHCFLIGCIKMVHIYETSITVERYSSQPVSAFFASALEIPFTQRAQNKNKQASFAVIKVTDCLLYELFIFNHFL